jgi:hypothetical protein
MVLAYLHLINLLFLAGTAYTFHRMPHLWQDQGVAYLALTGAGVASLSLVALGLWAMTSQQAKTGKVALHAFLALTLAAGIGYYAYRVCHDYNLITHMRSKLR